MDYIEEMDGLVARLRRTAVAVTASAAVLFASGASLVAGHLTYDRECAPAIAEHDHTAHRIQKSPEAAPDHCVACHVARVVRGSISAPTLFDVALLPLSAAEAGEQHVAHAYRSTDFTRGPPFQLES